MRSPQGYKIVCTTSADDSVNAKRVQVTDADVVNGLPLSSFHGTPLASLGSAFPVSRRCVLLQGLFCLASFLVALSS